MDQQEEKLPTVSLCMTVGDGGSSCPPNLKGRVVGNEIPANFW